MQEEMYRLYWNKMTKSIRLHEASCHHYRHRTENRYAQWSDPFHSKEEAMRKGMEILERHLLCAFCLSDHHCTEDVFAQRES